MNPEDFPQLGSLVYARARGLERAEQYVEWAHGALTLGFDGESLIRLDEAYWCESCRWVIVQSALSVDEAVISQARELIDPNWRVA